MNADADHAGSSDETTRFDHRIPAHLDPDVDVGRCGIHEGDPTLHQPLIHPPAHDPIRLGELAAIIDPEAFVGILEPERFDLPGGANAMADDVGQVDFALVVGRVHFFQARPENRRGDQVDSSIALRNRKFLGSCILGLDDSHDPALRIADDPPRDVPPGGQHDQIRAALGFQAPHLLERPGPQKWRIPVEDEDIALEILQGGPGGQHGVSGPELLGLHDEFGLLAVGLANGLPIATHDDDHAIRLQLRRDVPDMAEHRNPTDFVQNLGARGAHPCAFSGGQHDNRESMSDSAPRHPSVSLRIDLEGRKNLFAPDLPIGTSGSREKRD